MTTHKTKLRLRESRRTTVEEIYKYAGGTSYFEGSGFGIEETMQLPEKFSELRALAAVMGVRLELVRPQHVGESPRVASQNTKFYITRHGAGGTQHLWKDGWIVAAVVLLRTLAVNEKDKK